MITHYPSRTDKLEGDSLTEIDGIIKKTENKMWIIFSQYFFGAQNHPADAISKFWSSFHFDSARKVKMVNFLQKRRRVFIFWWCTAEHTNTRSSIHIRSLIIEASGHVTRPETRQQIGQKRLERLLLAGKVFVKFLLFPLISSQGTYFKNSKLESLCALPKLV